MLSFGKSKRTLVKILIVDNTVERDSWGSPELCRLSRLAAGAWIHVRRAPERDLPASPAGFDRIILSGSKTSALAEAPWIEKLFEFIRSAIDLHIPFLGVCYGQQALARALGGMHSVRKSAEPEFGWSE